MKIEDIVDLHDKLGSIDFSKVAIPEYSFPEIDFQPLEVMTVNPEDTIMGDIKRQIQAQNDLTTQQINILLEHNKLLSDNYSKLKEMYEIQSASYADAKEDLRKSRVFNIWMMIIAVLSMLAAIAGPIVTILVSG